MLMKGLLHVIRDKKKVTTIGLFKINEIS